MLFAIFRNNAVSKASPAIFTDNVPARMREPCTLFFFLSLAMFTQSFHRVFAFTLVALSGYPMFRHNGHVSLRSLNKFDKSWLSSEQKLLYFGSGQKAVKSFFLRNVAYHGNLIREKIIFTALPIFCALWNRILSDCLKFLFSTFPRLVTDKNIPKFYWDFIY